MITVTVSFRFWLHSVAIILAVVSMATWATSGVHFWIHLALLAVNLTAWFPLSRRYLRFE